MNPRIYLLTLAMFTIGASSFVVSGMLDLISAQMGVNVETAGQLMTAFSLTYAIGTPFFAALTGRVSRPRLLFVSLALFIGSTFLTALAPNFFLLMVARILAGAFAGLFSPTAYQIALSLVPLSKRGAGLAIVQVGITGAGVLGIPIGVYIGHLVSWQVTFILFGVIGLLTLLILFLVKLPGIPEPEQISLGARLAPLGQGLILLGLLPILLWNTGFAMLNTYIIPILKLGNYAGDIISLLLLVWGSGALLGMWYGGSRVDRLGPDRTYFRILPLQIVVFTLLPLAASGWLPLLLLALVLTGMAGCAGFPTQQTRLLTLSNRNTGTILALNNSVLYMGNALGALVGGVIINIWTVGALGLTAGTLAVLGFLALFLSIRVSRRPVAGAEIPAATSPNIEN